MTLEERIRSKEFVVTAELGPPASCRGEVVQKKAAYFRSGVAAVNITDNQTAIVRLSSIAAARILLEEAITPIIQVTCRDRNRIALQSDLLGAAALGIKNVLCLSGDFVSFGDHPEARPVFDLDSVQLIATVANLNKGFLLSGREMKSPTNFYIGAAANPFAPPHAFRITRLAKKIEAGARFIQTQPVFDIEVFAQWMEGVRNAGLHRRAAILAGVMPVKSLKALSYMQKEVPGMRVHPRLLERMAAASDEEDEGVHLAVETIHQLRNIEGLQGIHLMPLYWEKITPRILLESGTVKGVA